jgi:heme exporter protein A
MRLTAAGLSAMRGGRTVFADLSFSVETGGLLAVTGPNGSGKSTLLRVIAGLLAPTAGRIELAGADDGEPAAHYVGHLDALKPGLTVTQNLAFWRDVWGAGDMAGALSALGVAPLAHLPVAALSAGQRRRVALARLLVAPRPLWLLDEPATALDANAEAALAGLMSDHLGRGGIIVAATHRELPLPPTTSVRLGA